MNAFIIRPFNTKSGIDFEKVEKELITPALEAIGIKGMTTQEIYEAGNIRKDMFSLLLTSDLVIADLSIHNANVFYELGIRHAFRDKLTIFIRCSKDEIPFDLKTDRYLTYEADKPGNCKEKLIETIKSSIISNHGDSPLFSLIPNLKAQDPELFLEIPFDFLEEVNEAKTGATEANIGKLALLSLEVEGMKWEIPALRLIGEIQMRLKEFKGAKLTWEKIKEKIPEDHKANFQLAVIYQTLAEFETPLNNKLIGLCDNVVEKLKINFSKFDRNRCAEILSLEGHINKIKWIDKWRNEKNEKLRLTTALQHEYFTKALLSFENAFNEDLHHYHGGINALSLVTVYISLAENITDVWDYSFETEELAKKELERLHNLRRKLQITVQSSIDVERKKSQQQGNAGEKLNLIEAEYRLLTLSDSKRVKSAYQKINYENYGQNMEGVKGQLKMYELLNVLSENVKAAKEVIHNHDEIQKPHYLLFAGPTINKHNSSIPNLTESELNLVKNFLKNKVQSIGKANNENTIGLATGSSGTNILFHEICHEIGIPTHLYLSFPKEKFVSEYVQSAGTEWIDRFNKVYKNIHNNNCPIEILSEKSELPNWLKKKEGYSNDIRFNYWILNCSILARNSETTLLAIYDDVSDDKNDFVNQLIKLAGQNAINTVPFSLKSIIQEQ